MFEQSSLQERNPIGEWAVRGGFALLFLLAGCEKFGSSPTSQWVVMFRTIGFGQWFRYFTGVVEVLGAVLLLIPRTVTAGLFLLACTMLAAALLWIFRLGHPGNAIVCGALLGGLVAYGWNRRRSG
jgi:putative oxidoreductase